MKTNQPAAEPAIDQDFGRNSIMFDYYEERKLVKNLAAVVICLVGASCVWAQVEKPTIATAEQHALVDDGTVMPSAAGPQNVTKGLKTPSLVYQGRLYFFCCHYHLRRFYENPEQYVNNVTAPNGKDISTIVGVNPIWGQSADQPHPATNTQHALIKDGTKVISPASGKTITKSSKSPSAIYDGRIYYFCCQDDVRKFHANPGRYAVITAPPNGTLISTIIRQDRIRLRTIDKVLVPTTAMHALIDDETEMISLVTGESLTKKYKTPSAVYKGKLYYFCCDPDMRKFAANPEKYIPDATSPNGIDLVEIDDLDLRGLQRADQVLVATDKDHAALADGTPLISLISENSITKGNKTPSTVYRGRILYFCCHGDLRKFQANPARYIQDVIPPNGSNISQALKDGPPKPPVPVDIEIGKSAVLGPNDAPITIVEFGDFQCPFCIREWPKIKQVMDDYPGKVRLVFKHFPLSFHKKSPPVHAAAEFANRTKGVDAFWKMHDMIIANPKQLDVPTIRGYAEQLKLDLAEFDKLMADDTKINEMIETDLAEARTHNVRGTPTVFINNQKLAKRTPENYKARVDEILAEAAPEEPNEPPIPEPNKPAQPKQ